MLCPWKFKNSWTKFRVCLLIIVELEELSNFWHLIIPIFKPCIIISAMLDDDLSTFLFKLIEHKPNILRLGETFDGFSYDFYKKPAKICIFLLNFAKKILLPMSSASDISSVPSELFSKFNISFYNTPEDAVYKTL